MNQVCFDITRMINYQSPGVRAVGEVLAEAVQSISAAANRLDTLDHPLYTSPPPFHIEPGIYLDCNYAPAVIERMKSNGDGRTLSIGAKSWTLDDARLNVSFDKWAGWLQSIQPLERPFVYLDWEKEFPETLHDQATAEQSVKMAKLVLYMARIIQPEVGWGWYGMVPYLNTAANPVTRASLTDLQADAQFIVCSVYATPEKLDKGMYINHMRDKVEACLKFAGERPVLLNTSRLIKRGNDDGDVLPDDLARAAIMAGMTTGLDGRYPAALVLYDRTQPRQMTQETLSWQNGTYNLFRDAFIEAMRARPK